MIPMIFPRWHRGLFNCAVQIALLISLIGTALVYTQVESGSIVGTVRDPSGAVVAGASVTVTNTETNIARQVNTGTAGEYVVTAQSPSSSMGSRSPSKPESNWM